MEFIGIADILVFVGFVAAVLFIGLWMSKGEETHGEQGAQDYFLAGRKLTWWLVGFSLIAANISTEQFVGMSGQAADWLGMAIASYEWMAAITLVIVAFLFLPTFLRSGIYTIPEISMVGQTEEQLTVAKVPYEFGLAHYGELAKGQMLGDESGMLKLLFHRNTRVLLGVHGIGDQATELIHIGQAVMAYGGSIDYFINSVFNYPTLAEAYKVAAFDALNKL